MIDTTNTKRRALRGLVAAMASLFLASHAWAQAADTVATVGLAPGSDPRSVSLLDQSGQWAFMGLLNTGAHTFQGAASGASGQVQINNAGILTGATGLTFSGGALQEVTLPFTGIYQCAEFDAAGNLKPTGAPCGTGTYGAVGSVGLSLPASIFTVSGGPVTSSGTLTGTLATQAKNLVFAGPTSGSNAAPTFRALINSDLPTSVDQFGADPTGVNDSTTAINSALASGMPLTCSGIYKTTATLTATSQNNNGQSLTGGGSWAAGVPTTVPPGACIIRPTSAVTTAMLIDGSGFSSYIQGFSLSNIVFDTTNMTDASTTSAVKQVQAYDVSYERVRVINDGTSKRGWLFSAGAYTTTLLNTQANILDFEGASFGNGVTTITVINHDGFQVVSNYANGLKFWGGAYQGAGVHFSLTNTSDVDISSDVEGSGTYLALSGYSLYIRSHASLGGMAVGFTEVSGSCNVDCEIWDSTANGSNYTKYVTSGEISLNNQGSGLYSNRSSFLSGSSTQQQYLYVGRTAGESIWGVSANANDFVNGIAPGDTILGSTASGEATWLMAGFSPVVKMTAASFGLVNGAYFLATPIDFWSGSLGTSAYLGLGLTSTTSIVGVASAANAFANGTVAGDMVIGSYSTAEHTWLLCAGNPCWKGDTYGHQYTQGYPAPSAGTGTASVASNGNDNAFTFTSGSSVTSSTINFAAAWAVIPKCVVNSNSAAAWPYILSVSTTALTVGWSTTTSSESGYVRCEG